jgi:hypothetical protein
MSLPALACLEFIILTNQMGVKVVYFTVLICTSHMTNDTENFFMSLLVIHRFSFVNYLFTYFVILIRFCVIELREFLTYWGQVSCLINVL